MFIDVSTEQLKNANLPVTVTLFPVDFCRDNIVPVITLEFLDKNLSIGENMRVNLFGSGGVLSWLAERVYSLASSAFLAYGALCRFFLFKPVFRGDLNLFRCIIIHTTCQGAV